MTRPTRHLGVADENRQGRYPATNASVERWTRTAAWRAAREAWAGIALGLLLVVCLTGAWFVNTDNAYVLAASVLGAATWAAWRATR